MIGKKSLISRKIAFQVVSKRKKVSLTHIVRLTLLDEMDDFCYFLVDYHPTKIVTTSDDEVVRLIIVFLVLLLFHYR